MTTLSDIKFPIEAEGVRDLLPHRSPMLFVDRVLSCDEAGIHAQISCDPAWDLFNGHFPGRPILPGVIIVEMLAQAGALIGAINNLLEEGAFLAFSGVEKARFRKPVQPGDQLDLYVEVKASRRGFYKFEGFAKKSGLTVASVAFSATQMQFEA